MPFLEVLLFGVLEMAEKIRWGIIGTGWIAAKFAEGLETVNDCELVAVGSRSAASAEAFAGRFNIANCHCSYQSLSCDGDVDVVYIATPHPFHMDNTILCLNAGKAVLCEKPFAINASQSRKMVSAAAENGVFLMEAMWTRFLPAVAKVRELIGQGAIGEVRMLQADFGFPFEWDADSRAFDINLGGGALLDIGIYPLSFASMLFASKPEDIASLAHIGQTGVDEQSGVVLRYNKGQLAILYSTMMTTSPNEAFIMGTEGMIKVHSPFWHSNAITISGSGKEPQLLEVPCDGNGYNCEAEHVQGCIREGKLQSDIMPLDETLAIMETMDDIRKLWGLEYPMEKADKAE